MSAGVSMAQRTAVAGGRKVHLSFDGNTGTAASAGNPAFGKGVAGKGLQIRNGATIELPKGDIPLTGNFTVQFWVKTRMDAQHTAVLLSQKDYPDNSLASQKQAGWVFYLHGGTWAWNMGSGKRRITHEISNGYRMPVNDGKWHQLTMTYDRSQSLIRLYFDGDNRVLFNVWDSTGFDFTNQLPLIAGWKGSGGKNSRAEIDKGAGTLQQLVDAFHHLNLGKLDSADLETLIVEPDELVKARLKANAPKPDISPIMKLRSELGRNPYTVHQIREFMELAPLLKIYALRGDKIVFREAVASQYLQSEKLSNPDVELDELAVWDRALTPEEVMASAAKYINVQKPQLSQRKETLVAANWNIWHGGKHFSKVKDGWDSRERIAEILRAKNADVVMMQESYSSVDFIAAELGYYYATTVDWDYLNQGANISVLSRFPIREVYVPKGAAFMNVGTKIGVSKTQEVYVMSNWYGMNQFPAVYRYHEARFAQSDAIPVLFAGDFNAVPHTDGGDSPASRQMLASGFTDAYRSLYPDVSKYPGFSHRENIRIDQLYYKGKGLTNKSTEVISEWPAGFPSDHYLILSVFGLGK